MSEFFTEKQKNIIRKLKNDELRRLNILYGSVRSGKTWITLVVFALWITTMPKNGSYLMAGRTITTLKRNCLDLLQQIVGEEYFTYSTSSKLGILFGRKVYLEGANDARSEGKIRGMTLQGAYVDEITLIDEEFFTMLLSRLSEPKAKLFGSTNPDNPRHWLKTEYFDRQDEIDIYIEKYGIDDNTFLDPEYIRQIKAEYTGVFYERFISGDFALAEGLCFPRYEDAIVDSAPDTPVQQYSISIDYGTLNPFAAIMWEKHENEEHKSVWYAVKELYYSGRDTGIQKTDGDYLEMLVDFAKPVIKYNEEHKSFSAFTGSTTSRVPVIIDPSAASMITLLQRNGNFRVIPADNKVLDGIANTNLAMQRGRIKICRACQNGINELAGYVWDDSAVEDRPVKVNDHFCVTGDTLVDTDKGQVPIKQLVGKDGYVWSYNTQTEEAELKRFSGVQKTGEHKQIYKVMLSDGKVIRCTGDHPVLTKNGYKPVIDLKTNDEIVCLL